MSNKIYQKVASLSITHIKSFFNRYGLFHGSLAGFVSLRTIFMVGCLLLSTCSMFMAILAIKAQQEPATIEIHCPDNFNETIEKVRGEIESLRIKNYQTKTQSFVKSLIYHNRYIKVSIS